MGIAAGFLFLLFMIFFFYFGVVAYSVVVWGLLSMCVLFILLIIISISFGIYLEIKDGDNSTQ
jgi:hypothetical protein